MLLRAPGSLHHSRTRPKLGSRAWECSHDTAHTPRATRAASLLPSTPAGVPQATFQGRQDTYPTGAVPDTSRGCSGHL